MPSVTPDDRAWPPVLKARWLTQTFVHWPYPPEKIQAVLPQGLVVDRYDEMAWVTLTPFLMADVRPPGVPPAPKFTTFPETNLRTYVHGPNGRDGVWMLSIEVASAMMLAAGRVVGAPYHLGDLSLLKHGGNVVYAGTRRGGAPGYHLVIRPGERIRPSDRDIWLTSRWRAYTRRLGVLIETPVEHEPWPLSSGVIEQESETLVSAAGLPAPAGDPVVHFSEGVQDVQVGGPRPLLGHGAEDTDAAPGRPGRGAGPTAP